MFVKEAINLAKNGNENALEWLILHYEPIFKKHVKEHYGDEKAEKAAGDLKDIIKSYIEGNYSYKISDFLYNMAKNYEKPRRNIVGRSVTANDKKKFEKVVKHYSNSFYSKIKKFSDILSDEELRYFSDKLIRNLCKKSSNSKSDFRMLMNNNIKRKVDYYEQDTERLIKHYIEIIGITDGVLNYYCNKCKKEIESGKINIMYKYLILYDCKRIVKDSLLEYKSKRKDINRVIISNLNKAYMEDKEKIESLVTEIRQGKSNERDKVKIFYVYIKDIVFKDYMGIYNISDENLRLIIDEKYDKYIDLSLSKEAKTTVPRMICYYFKCYFKKPGLKFEICPEERQKIMDSYHEYFYYIDKYLQKLTSNYPLLLARKELIHVYSKIIKSYYLNGNKENLDAYIRRHMKNTIDYLNNKYQNMDIWNMAIHYKEQLISSSLFDEQMASNIIYNLTLYYLSQGVNNTEPFESYVFNAVRSICNKKQEYKVDYEHLPVAVLNYKKIK